MSQYRPRLSTDPGPRFQQCEEAALRLLRKAADAWAVGDPEEPKPEEILKGILKVFEEQRFLRRPW